MSEANLHNAEFLRKQLADLAGLYQSAELLPDQSLRINSKKVRCHVVRVQTSDLKRIQRDYSFEKTIWIDKVQETVLKTGEHSRGYAYDGSGRIPLESEIVETYPVTQLDSALPDDMFVFRPSAEARLVEHFPEPQRGGPDLTGQAAPSVMLKSADGKSVSLESFRGRPVLLDVWATWCGPCIAAMPSLATIYWATKDKGLVLLSVDEDEEAKTASDFLAKNKYSWQNFHDDGKFVEAIGHSGIPRAILIDSQGRVVLDSVGLSDADLRVAIARLGPEYASIAPPGAQQPCLAAK